ncbi:Serine/threonine-protein kinase mTOR [Trichinella patagoniensis]|uniref:Serine/threonine-protein kinase TOR n=1 Tax=Trichinella patagoniensis TaxID=990121 RepID=A0A0V0ZRR0_9BILA|nr:Serine/threonine-protein kinase mTOR [Trichinella patagoniensis]
MTAPAEYFLQRLCTKDEFARIQAAYDLYWYVKCELTEVPQEVANAFREKFDFIIPELLTSNISGERSAAIFAIACLAQGDASFPNVAPTNLRQTNPAGVASIRFHRYTHYLRNILPSSDANLVQLAVRAGAHLALRLSNLYTTEYVYFELKRATEWLQSASTDRTDNRLSAVIVMKELAYIAPTFFYQHTPHFFDCIFEALMDGKVQIRERAAEAIRAALVVTTQRETKLEQKIHWHKQCYNEANRFFEEARSSHANVREDRVHGGLLVLNELLRNANSRWERIIQEIAESNISRSAILAHSQELPKDFDFKERFTDLQEDVIAPLVSPSYFMNYESRNCRLKIAEEFNEICSNVTWCCSSTKASYNVQLQLALLCRLAAFDPQKFLAINFDDAVNYLWSCMTREKLRPDCLVAIGLFFMALKEEMVPYLPKVFDFLNSCLPTKESLSLKKRPVVVDTELFTCVTLIVRAVGSPLESFLKPMIEPMVLTGLSPNLKLACYEITTKIPSLKKIIEQGLLEQIYSVLLQQKMPNLLTLLQPIEPPTKPVVVTDPHITSLALTILGTFPFQRFSLESFLRFIPEGYFANECYEIRLEAVRCCCQILLPFVSTLTPEQSAAHNVSLLQMVNEVIKKFLDRRIRLMAFQCLTDSNAFCLHLAQDEVLKLIMMGLQDEDCSVREKIIHLLGKLTNVNPAYCVPALRRILMQIVEEMSLSGLSRNEEQSARLFSCLVRCAPNFVKPYAKTAFEVLLPKLKDSDTNGDVVVSFLRALGDLVELMPDKIEGYLDALLPVLIQLAQDTVSAGKRKAILIEYFTNASMWALSKVIECTGFAVEPHKRYQDLLDLLLRTLKSEQSPDIRRETIRLIGFIGALDPYKQKALHTAVDLASNCTGLALSLPHIKDITDRRLEILQWFHWERCSLEQFYPTFAIINLMSILSDSTYNQQLLTAAVHSLVFIYYSLNDKGLTALDQVFPTLVNIIRNSDPSMREFLFQQLGYLVSVVKHHVRPFLDDIFSLIRDFWTTKTQMRLTIILLVEQLAAALGSQFKPYAASIIPSMLRIFLHDTSVGRSVTSKLLDAFKKTSFILEDHFHLLLPPILSLAENVEVPIDVRRSAIETIDVFGETTSLSNFACRTVQTMVRVIDSEPELRFAAMDLFCTLILHLGEDFLPFCRVIDPCLERNDVVHERYISLILKTMEIGKINPTEEKFYKAMVRGRRCLLAKQQQVMQIEVRKVVCNVEQLRKIWLTNRCVSKEDWIAWLKRFSIQLLKESPVPALRSCYSVAVNHYQLASDLFNSAFASCWPELNETYQDELIETLQLALSASECPEIIQAILNLAEFIDHTEKGPLPIDPKLLGEKALETRAFAKALRCKEAEFYNEVTPEVLESLISINNMLQLRESSIGIVEIVRKRGIKVKDTERWYEKLNDWDKALEAYEAKQNQFPDDMELTLGRMRCLEALGNWSKVNEIVEKKWQSSTVEYKEKMAHIATCSAWGLGKWEAMQDYIAEISQSTVEGCFYRAVLAVHHQNFCEAQFRIDQARDLLDNELTAMLSESYSRAYDSIVMVQMLSELEETIDAKRNPEKRRIVPSVWWNRLQGCQRSVEDWQRILQVRSLVLTPDEMRQMLLKFASLCRKSGKLAVSRRTILTLMDCDPDSCAPIKLPFERPEVCYAYCKQLNCEGRRDLALSQLQLLLEYGFKKPATLPAELLSLKARCFLKLGQWSEQNLINEDSPNVEVMQHYMYATELDSKAYKPWNALACANFNALLYYRQRAPIPLIQCQNDSGDSPLKPLNPNLLVPGTVPDDSVITMYAVQAVKCFCRAVMLCHGNSLQDTLRQEAFIQLLTLWFDYGHIPEVYDTLISRIKTVRVETWLQVIPQLIARIDTPRHFVSHLIIEILMDIGKNHPQALIYPLTVASKSSSSARRQAADRVLKHMSDHSPNLVQQASMVSDELVRVAILWHELWHEALEEASRLFFSDRNVKGMLDLLNPLHALIERGATTMKEQSFNQAYYRDLKEAQELCIKFRQRGNLRDVTQAWDLYYNVFRRITKQLPLLSALDLQYVSPKLLKCKNLELAVPGTYDPSRPLVCIQSVQRSLQVIASKQRPRKICINGSDGQEYWFLLKGHEDTRQDERVMQLFGLVNTILLQNPTTCRLNLTIQRYSVIPLSPNSGLIGWVPNCDTLHALLRDYREKKKILLNLEHRIMQRVAPDYDHLPLMQKVEVFEFALEHTPGDDLQKILWLKSPNSEVWFDRRTNYTRSLATMSMVGYILGLGDRHPSNLMLERMSGKIVHIDFGDCFEVAINREKFPEKIPFRLTRMLINAMEVTGVEGNFRLTCEKVMSTLRANRESIMAVLEAFVYDPLFSWKLIEREQFERKTKNVSLSDDDAISLLSGGPGFQPSEFVSRKALDIIQRIRDKLTGRDFSSACPTTSKSLTVQAQVDLLIQQALSHENLCQCYIGWCPFW